MAAARYRTSTHTTDLVRTSMRKCESTLLKLVVPALVIGMLPVGAAGQMTTPKTSDELLAGFRTPPDSAKPRVWWHWMSGNVTKEGITADLEWMHRVGIGGMQMFDGDLGVAHYMKPVVFMTPEWQAMMKHAATEADRLHLEMAMAASGGWSETAGPWVKPAEAMKKAVWSETTVHGPLVFNGKLRQPPSVNGPFQGLATTEQAMTPILGGAPATYTPAKAAEPVHDEPFYADSVVLAFRLPKAESSFTALQPKVTASDAQFNAAALSDGDYGTVAELKNNSDGSDSWIQWEFPKAFGAASFTLGMGAPVARIVQAFPNGKVSYSEDGTQWHDIVSLPDSPQWARPFSVRTFTFAPVTARFFRLTLKQTQLTPEQVKRGLTLPAVVRIAEAQFYAVPRVNFYEDKASFGTFVETKDTRTPSIAKDEAIATKDVIDLTSKMKPDGTLDWQVPTGDWVVLRMGYSLTGKKNHPATPEATGYEVDKLSHDHVATYMDKYTSMIRGAVSPQMYGKSFQYFLMDSWEAGQENWTESMLSEFRKRRGYDPLPYLPALTGRIVGSAEASDAFLFDFRQTIADLLAENHYKLATDMLRKQGLGLYAEAMGISLPTTGDGLLNKGQVTVPMGEFWTPLPNDVDTPAREADVREASSAAHIYGKPIAATESFTSTPSIPGWAQAPYYLKQLADQNFSRGINRVVFHTSDHQPFVDEAHKPGITLGYFGQHYSRNITWAEQAVAWNTYLARCSYLLQQGKPVADVAYFYGEGAPIAVPYWKHFTPDVPATSLYDYVNSDVLLHQASLKDGRLQLNSGISYRVLVIPDEMTSLTLGMLRKVHELVKSGAVVVAPRVVASPSLTDTAAAAELQALVKDLWGADASASGSHSLGSGKVYWGTGLDKVLSEVKLDADFAYEAPVVTSTYAYDLPKPGADLVWTHRSAGPTDLYFVANQKSQSEDVETSYRVTGRTVELWHADTGRTEPASYEEKNGRTQVKLHLEPEESVFVVFRDHGKGSREVRASQRETVAELNKPWAVHFTGTAAPADAQMTSLTSWTTAADPALKYFSGTATYSQDVTVDAAALKGGSAMLLDLGRVREIAEVSVNGKKIDEILWKPPFVADITNALRPGTNHIEVRVTNLWPNRLIGDQQTGAEKHTFVVYRAYGPGDPLMESGLIGPVRIVRNTAANP